jgi:hypothetical protein
MVPWPQRAPGEARIAPATGGAHCSAALPIPRSASQAKPGARSERRAPRVRGKLPCLGPRARARGAEPCAFGARRRSALPRAPGDTSEHGWALSRAARCSPTPSFSSASSTSKHSRRRRGRWFNAVAATPPRRKKRRPRAQALPGSVHMAAGVPRGAADNAARARSILSGA